MASSGDAILSLSTDGLIETWNNGAATLYGYSAEQAIGQPAPTFLAKDPDRCRVMLASVTAAGGPARTECQHVRSDGTLIEVAVVDAPIIDERGRVVGIARVARDITDRRRSEDRFLRLLESAPDAMVIVDPGGEILLVNAQTEKLFGYRREELVGQRVEILVPDRFRDHHSDHHTCYSAHRLMRSMGAGPELYGRRKDGSEFPAEISLSPLETDDGTLVSSTICDISDRKRLEAEAAKARDEALAASKTKSAFLANMSHEIRTPLNGVIGMSDLLLDSPLDREQREHARLLKGAGETLVAVVDDILDFSKIEAGAMHLECVELDLLEAVEDGCDLIADSAQRKGVEVTLDLDPELPEVVRGDAVRLRQIITNLLSNAVKFTSDGEVRITLRVIGACERLTTVRVEVADTGIGIEENRLEQMFEPFVQEDDSTTRRFGGTGLGLAIVKQLVVMMDGEVGVTSTRGQGSTFWFTLLLERGDASRQRGAAEAPLAGYRLLVVDDHETNRRLLVQLARRWDLDVDAVPDAVQALARLRDAAARQEPFDCAALDMHMLGMDGIELAEAIHRDESFPTPALVMLVSTTEQRREAREAGIDVHMTKPVRRSRMQSALAESLGIQTRRNRRAAEHDIGAGGESSPLILVVEDNDVNQILAVSMLERCGYRTEVAGDGREALAMLEQQTYAAVLMDCQMPEMNGYDATRELRQREQGRSSTPVIAMTANALRGDREKCLASGMDDYLPKPLRREDFDRLIERWAPKARISQDPSPGPQPQPTPGPLDPAGIEIFLSESGAVAATVIDLFGQQTPGLLAQMRAAIDAADALALGAAAHTLQGSCLALAATQMARRCQELESRACEGTTDGTTALVNQIETDFAATLEALLAHTSNT